MKHQGSNVASHRFTLSTVLGLMLLAAATPSAFGQLPEAPAIDRDVANVRALQFTRPYMTPLRTTADGRVGLNTKKTGGQKLNFYLIRPESMTDSFVDSPAGLTILESTTPFDLSASLFAGTGEPIHHAICDATPVFPEPGQHTNPYACGRGDVDDCYDVTVVTGTQVDVLGEDHVQLWGTDITVRVTQPKSNSAQIAEITVPNAPVQGGRFLGKILFETFVTNDGRFLIGRIGTRNYPWTNPNTYEPLVQGTDIVYSVYPETEDPCDVTQWTEVHPISHAPHDPEVNTRYPFAMHPFRSPEGTPIPDGWDLRATYPWIDRTGRNIFFTVIGEVSDDRYDYEFLDNVTGDPREESGITRGHAMMGLWTQGKMVLFDGPINNVDYGIRMPDEFHKLMQLFEPNTGPPGEINANLGKARLASGRDNKNVQPPGSVENTTFFDSPEHLYNFRPETTPVKPGDVVWLGNTGRASDELRFDDYLNPDSFILSNMAGSLTFDPEFPDTPTPAHLDYNDGWDEDSASFTAPIRYQNAATALPDRWVVPPFGEAVGNVRVEPAALGGVDGRGVWVDGQGSGIAYHIQSQAPATPETETWYVGLFFDSRSADDQVERTLVSFIDGSELRLLGRRALTFADAAGVTKRAITLPTMLNDFEWGHVGIEIAPGGKSVLTYYNGYAIDHWTSTTGDGLFPIRRGTLYLGTGTESGDDSFRGWLDEFKVIAQPLNAETACNHATGTLIGLPASDTGPWSDLANAYPGWAHERLSDFLAMGGADAFERYACYLDLSADYEAHLGNLPGEGTSVRHGVNFPESPIFHDASRPNSLGNAFCVTCHVDSAFGGMTLEALEFRDGEPAVDDDRRQPMQAPRLAFGRLPADWLGNGEPSFVAPQDGQKLDEWLLPGLADVPLAVTTFTLVDAASDRDLMPVVDGTVIDVDALGSNSLTLRANTTWPEGSVVFDYDGATGFRTEDLEPYALFGADGHDYAGGGFRAGSHTVTATPYPDPGGGGTAGIAASINFQILVTQPQIVADYRADFVAGSQAPGWSYLWNGDPIGQSAGYVSLIWDGQSRFDSDGIPGFPDSTDAGWASLEANGGRPGWSDTQGGQSDDRHAIAAFTVDRFGAYSIVDCTVASATGIGDGVEVRLYVGDNFRKSFSYDIATSQSLTCDWDLGTLNAGKTIYLAVGPRGANTSDRFDLDFKIKWSVPPIQPQ